MDIGGIEISSDKTKEFKGDLKKAIQTALEMIGMTAEHHAKKKCPVDTGNLRNSITHVVDDDSVYIGTNVEYAAYVELGTGVYYPGGRQGGWAYVNDEGNGHFTYGSKPRPFLKPAATEHSAEYKKLFESALKG